MKKLLVFILIVFIGSNSYSQNISLEDCYRFVRENFPAGKKLYLVDEVGKLTIDNTTKVYLPQVSLQGQGTYQSDVTSLPIKLPNLTVPTPPKDQYRIQAEVSQLIYDGGAIKAQQNIIKANDALQKQNVEVTLFALKERVAQLYFGVLLYDAQLVQRNILRKNLNVALAKAEAAYKNGTAFKSNVTELKAELINADMADAEIKADRQGIVNVLEKLLNIKIAEGTLFQVPEAKAFDVVNRPELKLFDLQSKLYDAQEQKLKTDRMPKLSAFAQGGYGNPGLNMLKDKFVMYGIGGLRVTMPLSSLYTEKNNKRALALNKKQADIDKETFLLNTNTQLEKEKADMNKYKALLQKDDEIIALRTEVVKSAQAQLDNGVITVSDFINKLNAENLAKQTKNFHSLLLLKAQINYQNISGN